jgi:hypothetical protein
MRPPSAPSPAPVAARPTPAVAPASPPPAVAAHVPRAPFAPIGNHTLTTSLDRAALRASNRALPDTAFRAKFDAARVSPLRFFRSFPSAYYRDLKGLAEKGVPGGTGTVLGDPHPDNFGFLRTAKGTEYAFNDYDDSGRGPVALDALRYFTALRLTMPGKDKLFERTLDSYVKAVKAGASVDVPKALRPDWSEVQKDTLKKFTVGSGFRYENEKTRLTPAPARLAQQVRDVVAHDARFGKAEVLDVGVRARDYGGSGGLQRVWVLVVRDGTKTIIELKEAGPPGIDELGGPPLPEAQRLSLAKSTFLERPDDTDIFPVTVNGTSFVVRDRTRMSGVNFEDLSKDDRHDVLDAQAGIMAKVHRDGWADVGEHEIRAWLDEGSQTLANRWTSMYEAEKSR